MALGSGRLGLHQHYHQWGDTVSPNLDDDRECLAMGAERLDPPVITYKQDHPPLILTYFPPRPAVTGVEAGLDFSPQYIQCAPLLRKECTDPAVFQ